MRAGKLLSSRAAGTRTTREAELGGLAITNRGTAQAGVHCAAAAARQLRARA